MVGQARWLRKFLRRKMMPIPEDEAYKWKSRLSLGYMFLAWNAVGAVAYAIYTGKLDWADYYGLKTEEEKKIRNNEYFAKSIGRPDSKTKLVTWKGLTEVESKVYEYESKVPTNEVAEPESKLTLAQRIERRQRELDQMEAERRQATAQSELNPQIG